MPKRLYKVIDDEPERFRLAIYADHEGNLQAGSALFFGLLGLGMLSFLLITIYSSNIWPSILVTITLIFAAILAKFIWPDIRDGGSSSALDVIDITPITVNIGRNEYPRDSFRSFREFQYRGGRMAQEVTFLGISFTTHVSDIRLYCSFRPDRLNERTEVIRLLNNALQRIPTASVAHANEIGSDAPDIAQVFL